MSGEKTTESMLVLSEADRTALSNVIYENILGDVPASELAAFLDALIEKNPLLVAEGVYWGFDDTLVREQIMSGCSEWLIGRSWPKYGDQLSDEQMETFIKDLKKSYDEFIVKNKK